MATLLQIHSSYIKEIFENTPRFLPKDRETLFELPTWTEAILAHLHSDVSRLGFILQLGYFRATHRFFPLSRFQRDDAQFIISRFGLALEPEEIGAYPSSTRWDHQQIICSQMGFNRFSKTHREQLLQEAKRLCSAHMRPDELFDYLICYLEERRVKIPSYRTLAELLTNALLFVEKKLLAQLEQILTPADEAWLDKLLQPHPDYGPTDDRKVKRYTLTFLKNISQSLRGGSIRERVEHYRYLQSVFTATKPLVAKLNLSDQSIRYYAQYVLRAQPAQLYRRQKQRYLFLIGFIIHQYYEWTDALVDTLLQTISHFFSQCEAQLKEQYYEEREAASQLTQQVTDRSREQLTALAAIRQVVKKNEINQAQKLIQIEQLIDWYFPSEQDWQAGVTALDQLEQINDRYHQQDAYYAWLSKHSIKLQR